MCVCVRCHVVGFRHDVKNQYAKISCTIKPYKHEREDGNIIWAWLSMKSFHVMYFNERGKFPEQQVAMKNCEQPYTKNFVFSSLYSFIHLQTSQLRIEMKILWNILMQKCNQIWCCLGNDFTQKLAKNHIWSENLVVNWNINVVFFA